MYAAYKPGFDKASVVTAYTSGAFVGGSADECWDDTMTTVHADDSALSGAVPGCIKSTTTPFAICDSLNGWVMPTYSDSATMDSTWQAEWNGQCIPACYKAL